MGQMVPPTRDWRPGCQQAGLPSYNAEENLGQHHPRPQVWINLWQIRTRTPVRFNDRTIQVDHPGLNIVIVLVVRDSRHVRWKEESRYEDIHHSVEMKICSTEAAELDGWANRLGSW